MIIKRQYVPFKFLLNRDADAEKLFMDVFEKSYQNMKKEHRDEWFSRLVQQSLSQRDMGWCMTEIRRLIEGFEKLDKEKPYDNGLTYNDVQRIVIVQRDETGITAQLIGVFDGEEYVVSVERIGQ